MGLSLESGQSAPYSNCLDSPPTEVRQCFIVSDRNRRGRGVLKMNFPQAQYNARSNESGKKKWDLLSTETYPRHRRHSGCSRVRSSMRWARSWPSSSSTSAWDSIQSWLRMINVNISNISSIFPGLGGLFLYGCASLTPSRDNL